MKFGAIVPDSLRKLNTLALGCWAFFERHAAWHLNICGRRCSVQFVIQNMSAWDRYSYAEKK